MTCPLFCDLFIALIAKQLYSALCFLVLLRRTLSFSSFFVQFFFECRFYFSLFFYGICFRVRDSCTSCLVISMGNVLLRFVSGILTAMFFLRSVHIFSRFLKSNWGSHFGHAQAGIGAKKRVIFWREIFSP